MYDRQNNDAKLAMLKGTLRQGGGNAVHNPHRTKWLSHMADWRKSQAIWR